MAVSLSTRASSGSTVTATTWALPRAGRDRWAAASGPMFRGLAVKNMKPRKAAPPARAASTACGVESPQILVRV
jgi:hypothetical protein